MGRQLRYWLLPEDFDELQQAIEATGVVCFLQDRTPTADLKILNRIALPSERMGKENLRIWVARRHDLSRIRVRFVESQGYWVVQDSESPVIELDRCYFTGTLLRKGRIYFATDQRFIPAPRSEEFLRWGDLLLRRVRKLLIREPKLDGYISARVQAWVRKRGAVSRGLDLVAAD